MKKVSFLFALCTIVAVLVYIGIALKSAKQEIALLHNQNKFIVKYLSGGIQNIPKAYGPLRSRQEVLLQCLTQFDEFAKKHNIEYWLDYGTLLGAIRHGGFIPWDDDIDISMTEENLMLLRELAKNQSHGITLTPATNNPKRMLWYFTNSVGTLDIFSHVFIKQKDFQDQARYTRFMHHLKFIGGAYIQNQILERLDSIKQTPRMNDLQEYFLMTRVTAGSGTDSPYNSYFKALDVFPLKALTFEGHEFPVPRNADEVLKTRYGEHYTDLPDAFGYSHHINSW
jgi:lipopolysaccharide cholinephosphotransferase